MLKTFDYEKLPIVEVVNEILYDSAKRGASDIHFDPEEESMKVRIRIDGELVNYTSIPNSLKKNLITRIKIISGMNITEVRLPQDGAIKQTIKDQSLDLRVSSLPTNEGEKIATATAFYDIHGRDTSNDGWLHWVAIKREYQGKGLSKPLITYVLNVMKNLGYSHAKIPTQTNTWLACKVYLDLGFLPVKENLEHSYEGWKIVKELTGHSALKDM